MFVRVPSVLTIALFASSCVEIRRPGEHEAQQSLILGTPTYETTVGFPSEPVQYQIIEGALPEQGVILVANDTSECDSYRAELVSRGAVTLAELDAGLRCEVVAHDDLWFRDMGGVFVHTSLFAPGHRSHGAESLTVVDFVFDGWGYEAYIGLGYFEVEDEVASLLAGALDLSVISSPLITEGGAFISNGAGTTLYSLGALTQRNPTWTISQIEAELARTLGASTLIALPEFHPLDGHSVLDGPLSYTDSNGGLVCSHLPTTVRHADEFVAFLDEDTLLVSQMEEEDVRNVIDQQVKDMLDRAWTYLEDETDFDLVAFPEAGLIPGVLGPDDEMTAYLGSMSPLPGEGTSCEWDAAVGGSISLAGTYMNYVVTNGTVFAPQLSGLGNDPKLIDLDAEVITILGDLYPGRVIVPLENRPGAYGGGGSHCWTQEVVGL